MGVLGFRFEIPPFPSPNLDRAFRGSRNVLLLSFFFFSPLVVSFFSICLSFSFDSACFRFSPFQDCSKLRFAIAPWKLPEDPGGKDIVVGAPTRLFAPCSFPYSGAFRCFKLLGDLFANHTQLPRWRRNGLDLFPPFWSWLFFPRGFWL